MCSKIQLCLLLLSLFAILLHCNADSELLIGSLLDVVFEEVNFREEFIIAFEVYNALLDTNLTNIYPTGDTLDIEQLGDLVIKLTNGDHQQALDKIFMNLDNAKFLPTDSTCTNKIYLKLLLYLLEKDETIARLFSSNLLPACSKAKSLYCGVIQSIFIDIQNGNIEYARETFYQNIYINNICNSAAEATNT